MPSPLCTPLALGRDKTAENWHECFQRQTKTTLSIEWIYLLLSSDFVISYNSGGVLHSLWYHGQRVVSPYVGWHENQMADVLAII